MRSSGGVYQPTTTGFGEQRKSWSTGPRFLGPGGSTTGVRCWPRSMVLLLAGLFALMGLVMVIVGSKWHQDMAAASSSAAAASEASVGGDTQQKTPDGDVSPPPPSATPYITILVVGLLLILVAFVGLVAYYRSQGLPMPCCPGKIAHIRERLHVQQKFPSGAPICAQYCPPSSSSTGDGGGGGGSPPLLSSPSSPPSSTTTTTSQPMHGGSRLGGGAEPPFADVSEQQRLMGDDTERMLEDDPRIVLTPLKTHEEC